MCSGSEAGSYLRLIDFMYRSTLGLRVIKKRKEMGSFAPCPLFDGAVSVSANFKNNYLAKM